FVGFDAFGEEYKVMGLAPYGEDRYADVMRELVRLDDDHWYRLGNGFFGMHEGGESGKVDEAHHIVMGRLFSDRLRKLLGEPRARNETLTQRDKDIARSTQVRFEQAAEHCIRKLHRLVPTHRLAMAGGRALDRVAN